MEEEQKILVKNILKLMEDRDMNQADLARGIGVSESAASKWLTGYNTITFKNIQKIADFFDVPKSALLDEQKPASRKRQILNRRVEKATDDEIDKILLFWNQFLDPQTDD